MRIGGPLEGGPLEGGPWTYETRKKSENES